VLIVVLWGLFFLGSLAVAVGLSVGARVEGVRRLSDRLGAHYAARAGVERSKTVLSLDTNAWDATSERWADSPADFKDVRCGEGIYSVCYLVEKADGTQGTNYGMRDEQAFINLNSERLTGALAALLRTAGGMDAVRAATLADNVRKAVAATKQDGQAPPVADGAWIASSIPGGPLRSVYELLWIKGMDDAVLEKIRNHITVHGGARVNINTADAIVLMSMIESAGPLAAGVAESLARKVLNFRGNGGKFQSISGLSAAIGRDSALSEEERRALDSLSGLTVVASDHYRGVARGKMRGREASVQTVEFVWNRKLKRIEHWHED
jgi:type II secretory pathway component PulK